MNNKTPHMQPVSAGHQWFKRILHLINRAGYTCAVIALYTWLSHWISTPTVTSSKFSIQVVQEQGSKKSRCPDNCPHIGDTYTAITSGGSPDLTISIYAYSNERLIASCHNCTSLSIVIKTPGKITIVGVELEHSRKCDIDKSNLDELEASAISCGQIESAFFDVL